MKNEINSYILKINEYFAFRKQIIDFYVSNALNIDEQVIIDLKELIKCQELRNKIRESEVTTRKYFGSHWKAEHTDPKKLYELSDWIIKFRKLLLEDKITHKSIEIVSTESCKEKTNQIIINLNNSYDKLNSALKSFETRLNTDLKSTFINDITSIPFSEIKSHMEIFLQKLPKLIIWSQFLSLRKEQTEITEPIIRLSEDNLLDPDDIIPCFKGNFADNLLKEVFISKPALSSFIADLHENKINKFTELDNELLWINRERTAHNISQRRPNVYGNLSPNSELWILLSEFNRKRRHMPIRKLLTAAGGLIQRIKPCFMMSLLFIAQFIEPQNVGNILFDVIIFEEASQVKPEDALGALLRGKQLVVWVILNNCHQTFILRCHGR